MELSTQLSTLFDSIQIFQIQFQLFSYLSLPNHLVPKELSGGLRQYKQMGKNDGFLSFTSVRAYNPPKMTNSNEITITGNDVLVVSW